MAMKILIFMLFSYHCTDCVKIGAIFKQPEDSHLSETFRWAVEWSRTHMYSDPKSAEFLEYKIEYISNMNFEHKVIQTVCRLANDGIIAVFSGSDVRMSRVIKNVADHLNLLFFNIVWDNEAEKDALNFFPDPQKFVQAFEDLVLFWQWSRLVIIYEDNGALGRLEHLLISERLNKVNVSIIRVDKRDYVGALKRAKYGRLKNIIIDIPTKTLADVFMAALQLGMINHQYSFLITSLDFHSLDFKLFRHNHGRITGFTIVNNSTVTESPVFNYIQDHLKNETLKNFPATEIALMFDAVFAYARGIDNVSRLLFDDKISSKAHCQPYGAYQAHPLGSTFFNYITHSIAHDNGLTGSLKFRGNYREALQLEIYQLGYDGNVDSIGTWNSSGKLVQMDNESAVPYNADALHVTVIPKPHFRITTLLEKPYVQHKPNYKELTGNDRFEGFCIALLKMLADEMKFTYTIRVVENNTYGMKNATGQWDGMIGDILNNISDMAVAPLTITASRLDAVDFTTPPFLSFGIGVLIKIPHIQRPGLFSFMKPLSSQLWMSMLVAALVTIILAYIIARITPYEWRAPRSLCAVRHPREATYAGQENVLVNNYTLANSTWYVATTFLRGCAHFAPKSISTRLLGGFWWVFCLVMISAYTANLAAVLTVDRRFLPIKSLEDLADQDKISFGAIKDGSTAQFFNESKITAHQKMWHRMVNTPSVFVNNNPEGLEKVVNEDYALLMESRTLEYLIANECNLMQLGTILGSNGYGIALRKGSPWTQEISLKILEFSEKGKIEQIKSDWWRGPCHQTSSATMKEERVALNMDSVAGLFLILLAGLCLAVVLGIIEFIVKNKENADIEQRSIWAEMAHELCLAFRTPRSSRRHQIQRRCSRCDVNQSNIAQTASLLLGGGHRSRRISRYPSSDDAKLNRTDQSDGGVAMVPIVTHHDTNNRLKCSDHQRSCSASASRAPVSPYCVVRHRVDADVVEFHENGKLLEHHDNVTTLSSLSKCSTQEMGAGCAFGLPSMR